MKLVIIINLFIFIISCSFALLFKINLSEYANIYKFLLGIYFLLLGIVIGNLTCFNLELIQNKELQLKLSNKIYTIIKITSTLFIIQIILELIKFVITSPYLYFFNYHSFLLLCYSMFFYCYIIKTLVNTKKTILLIIEEQKNIL